MKKVLAVGVPTLCSLLFSGCSVSKTPEPVQSTEVTEEISTGILETEVIVEDVTEEQDVVDTEEVTEVLNIEDAYAKIAYLGEGLNQKEGRYEKYFVVDMEYGLGIDFSSVSIGELEYHGGIDGRIDAIGYDVSAELVPDIQRYVIMVSDSEDFLPEDVSIGLVNKTSDKYEPDATGTFETAQMTDFSYDMLGSGYYSLIEVDGNVYLLDISSITYTSSSDGNNIWYLTEDAVKFASNGSSAEALFKALAGKGKFVTYSGGKYVESTSGTSTVEANFGRDGKWRLIKKINPSIEESFYLIPRMENKDTTDYSNSTFIWI